MNATKTCGACGCLLLASLKGFSQADSLTVYFQAEGPRRERFDVYFEGQPVLSTRRGGSFFATFTLPINPTWQKRTALEFFIHKPQLFGLWHKNVGLVPTYDPARKYLVIYRDPDRKNKAPFTFYWSEKALIVDRRVR